MKHLDQIIDELENVLNDLRAYSGWKKRGKSWSKLSLGGGEDYTSAPGWEDVYQDLDKCPGCGGPADNGHDREMPPSPYYCTKCHEKLNETCYCSEHKKAG